MISSSRQCHEHSPLRFVIHSICPTLANARCKPRTWSSPPQSTRIEPYSLLSAKYVAMYPIEPPTRKSSRENRNLTLVTTRRSPTFHSQIAKVKYDAREAVETEPADPVPHSISKQPEGRSASNEERPPVPSVLLRAENKVDK